MKKITMFTDGSSRGNPGNGGYGTIIVTDSLTHELGGYNKLTTNNIMEMTAVIMGFEYIANHKSVYADQGEIHIYSDSSYVVTGITAWIHGWQKNNWKTANKKPVLNQELWMEMSRLRDLLSVSYKLHFHHIRGHAGIPGNERCDVIATSFADSLQTPLFHGSFTDYETNNPNILSV